MKNEKGATFVEIMIIIIIMLLLSSVAIPSFLNNRGATEKRAFSAAKNFLERNNIKIVRLTCAGDSNNDGYGTCNIVTSSNEKIILDCPTNYFDVVWFGASECKEVFQNFNVNIEN